MGIGIVHLSRKKIANGAHISNTCTSLKTGKTVQSNGELLKSKEYNSREECAKWILATSNAVRTKIEQKIKQSSEKIKESVEKAVNG